MKSFDIGTTILELRKQNNLTQEKLANMLGISAGAISKWETGNSTPNISLISPLARALNTTTDFLLSFKEQLSEKEITEIKEDLKELFLQQGNGVGKEKCKEYIREYPTSINLKFIIASIINMYGSIFENTNSDNILKNKEYALSLYEEVVKSNDVKYTNISLFSMASIHMTLGNYEESEKIINKLIPYCIDPMTIYPMILKKQNKSTEAKKSSQTLLLKYINQSISMLIMMSIIARDALEYDKCNYYLETAFKLEETFEVGIGLSSYEYCKLYIQKQDYPKAAQWFETYTDKLLSAKFDYFESEYFDTIILETKVNEQKLIRKNLIKAIISENEFKILENEEKYQFAIAKLKK